MYSPLLRGMTEPYSLLYPHTSGVTDLPRGSPGLLQVPPYIVAANQQCPRFPGGMSSKSESVRIDGTGSYVCPSQGVMNPRFQALKRLQASVHLVHTNNTRSTNEKQTMAKICRSEAQRFCNKNWLGNNTLLLLPHMIKYFLIPAIVDVSPQCWLLHLIVHCLPFQTVGPSGPGTTC